MLIPTKINDERNNKIENPVIHLPRLTEQDLQDYIHWQEQIKSSLERRVQTMHFAAHQESDTVSKNNIPLGQSDRLKAADIVYSERHDGSGHESSLSAIHTEELGFWVAPEKNRHDL